MNNSDIENKKISYNTFVIPLIIVLLMSIIKMLEVNNGYNLSYLGVYPKNIKGISGILFSPFIHSSVKHLFNNIIPLFFLFSAMIHFYNSLAYIIYISIHIFSGVLLWFIGREVFHIGASGIVYGLASFMFFSGVIRKNIQLLSFSLLITFLYGSMVWGIFPETVKKGVSWEAHLSGTIIGIINSILFLNQGPQKKRYEWEEDDEEDSEENENDEGNENYVYHVVEN